MIRCASRLVGLLLVVTLGSGCASQHEGEFNSTLLPRVAVAPESLVSGRMALLVKPQVQDKVHEIAFGHDRGVRLQVGASSNSPS